MDRGFGCDRERGLVKKRPFPVGAEEWRLAVRDALAELQREADTADHARPEPPTAHVYDVHSPGNPVVTCLAADLPRTVGDIQKTAGQSGECSAAAVRAFNRGCSRWRRARTHRGRDDAAVSSAAAGHGEGV